MIKLLKTLCSIDDFHLVFEPALRKRQISTRKKTRNKKSTMSMSEIVSITVLFHLSGMRTFKHFYLFYVQKHLKQGFPNTISYNGFTGLMQVNILTLSLHIKTCCLGECIGLSFIGSTPIRVCNKKRIKQNKVFKNIATIGKSIMAFFMVLNFTQLLTIKANSLILLLPRTI